jgi:proteasomal ATPase-associated factor 1
MQNHTQHIHPVMQIQCNWEDFLRDMSAVDKFWITYDPNDPNSNSKIYCDVLVVQKKEFKCDNPEFKVSDFDPRRKMITVSHEPSHTLRKYIAPSEVYSNLMNKNAILSMDLSPGGNLGITGSYNGRLRVWDANNGTLRRDLQGHVGDIYVCRILPSGKVAMSGGGDLQIKIWNIADEECAVTLKGHRAGITSIDFIDRGRNFISSSRDGAVLLWDCASQSIITELRSAGVSSVNQVSVAKNNQFASSGALLDSREYSVEGHIVAFVSDNGSLIALDIRSRKPIFSFTSSSGLECCKFLLNGNVIIAGSQNGCLLKSDLRMNATPEYIKISRVTVKSMAVHNNESLWCTTADGSCMLWNCTKNEIVYDLSGSDYDPLFSVCAYNKNVYTGCRDGCVRKYIVPD